MRRVRTLVDPCRRFQYCLTRLVAHNGYYSQSALPHPGNNGWLYPDPPAGNSKTPGCPWRELRRQQRPRTGKVPGPFRTRGSLLRNGTIAVEQTRYFRWRSIPSKHRLVVARTVRLFETLPPPYRYCRFERTENLAAARFPRANWEHFPPAPTPHPAAV